MSYINVQLGNRIPLLSRKDWLRLNSLSLTTLGLSLLTMNNAMAIERCSGLFPSYVISNSYAISCYGDQSKGIDGIDPAFDNASYLYPIELTITDLKGPITSLPNNESHNDTITTRALGFSPAAVNILRFGRKGNDGGYFPFKGHNGDHAPMAPFVDINFLIKDNKDNGGIDVNGNGINAISVGGVGGNGGESTGAPATPFTPPLPGIGGTGGTGGAGGLISVNNEVGILAKDNIGIVAYSAGGTGGNGGWGTGGYAGGGTGGTGGSGNIVIVQNTGDIGQTSTSDDYGSSIVAKSVGSAGGSGGTAVGQISVAGAAGRSGTGGTVIVENSGSLTSTIDDAAAIQALSIGGGESDGGTSVGIIAIGGDGSPAGHGGQVVITNQGDINTYGESSSAIQAQSIGGTGGNGGSAVASFQQITIAKGGEGGDGGHGNAVIVNLNPSNKDPNQGNLHTRGSFSHGIQAQSVGGGGGNGGTAISAAVGYYFSSAVALGGSGGNGGDGSLVSIDTNAEDQTYSSANIAPTIVTEGDVSFGLLGQSIGGGGGNGGFAIAAAAASKGVSTSFSMGGSGGGGGNGGEVTIDSDRQISTQGLISHGIFAQSIGGGGGNGSTSIAGGMGKQGSANVAIGGSGGDGGFGNQVTVNHQDASITTQADHASGIVAQSIGGGGGNGALSVSGSIGVKENKSAEVSVGGSGGAGGLGGVVIVNNQAAAVTTHGDHASAIMAQSIGGGGGNGGVSVSGGIGGKESKKVEISVGGSGGSGGFATAVKVTNSGELDTYGDFSHGIVSQAIGGGGGNGGASISGTLGLTSSDNKGSNVNIAVAVGGSGGSGTIGGQVLTTNDGDTHTRGDNAHGIYAQSIGGGGGDGGLSFAGAVSLGSGSNSETPNSSVNVTVGVGGEGGSAGVANIVDIDNNGTIVTDGTGSRGIVAQSIGGGGGNGGQANSMSLALVAGDDNDTAKNYTANIAVGGNGGTANHGNTVDVDNDGSIATNSFGGHGIVAQSIGGGGGTGGNGGIGTGNDFIDTLIDEATDSFSAESTFKSVEVAVGGQGGAGGDGNAVSVSNTGSIITNASVNSLTALYAANSDFFDEATFESSYGILAQSIGGGGGYGGNTGSDVSGLGANVFLGGESGGNGGTVDVQNIGLIQTKGNGSTAILAQSIGGGGGIAGNVSIGTVVDTGINTSFDIGNSDDIVSQAGAYGSGGEVTVTNEGTIKTAGDYAMGIFAQSVGGGGGIAGSGENGLFVGTVGEIGNASDVTVSSQGNIVTKGEGSHAIFAQSAAGRGSFSGNINISLDGKIRATGDMASAVYAQSRGAVGVGGTFNGDNLPNTNGNINITITESGLVKGGTNAAAINIQDGAQNNITNHGRIIGADDGYAITGTVGEEVVTNYGEISGSIDLDMPSDDPIYTILDVTPNSQARSFSNELNNKQGALFNTGSEINLGNNGSLNNQGQLAIGGMGHIQNTQLTGDLFLKDTSEYFTEIDFTTGFMDTLTIEDKFGFDGSLNFSFFGDMPEIGLYTFLIFDNFIGESFDSVFIPKFEGFEFNLLYAEKSASLQITSLDIDVRSVPIPAAWLLFISGFGLISMVRSKKTKRS